MGCVCVYCVQDYEGVEQDCWDEIRGGEGGGHFGGVVCYATARKDEV